MAGEKFLNGIDMSKTQIQNHSLHVLSGDPGTPVIGQISFDSATDHIRIKKAAASKSLADLDDLIPSNIAGFDTQVRTSRLDQMAQPTGAIAMNSQKLTGLANGSSASDSAAFGQIDTAIQTALEGKSYKDAVRAATTAAVTLSTGLVNGSTIDGVTLATGDRILVKNQAAPAENGIRVVAASGVPPRAADASTSAELRNATVIVSEGTTLNGTQWTQTTDGVITLDTTAIAFVQTGAGSTPYTAGNGLTLSGNDFNIGVTSGLTVAADSVGIDTSVVVRKYAVLIGNASLTTIDVVHGLGTKDITWSIRQASDDLFVHTDGLAFDTNTLRLTFAVAPTSNQYKVTVHG